MRIAIITIGSRGDVQPFIALGQGLIKAGHTVRLVTHQDFEVFVESHGLEFWLIRGNPQELVGGQEMREVLEKGNLAATWRQMMRGAERAINEWMEDSLAACQGMDLLIAGTKVLIVVSSLVTGFRANSIVSRRLIQVTPDGFS